MQNGWAVMLGLLLLGGCASAQNAPSDAQKSARDPWAPKPLHYMCADGFVFSTLPQKGSDQIIVRFLGGQEVPMLRVPAASGAKYTDDRFVFWSKGDEAMLTLSGTQHQNCRVADLELRANGNEPGWYLTIERNRQIEFVGDYGEVTATTPYVEPVVDRKTGTRIWQAETEGSNLRVEATRKSCSDGMSDQAYDTAVTVVFNGKTYQGCGQNLE